MGGPRRRFALWLATSAVLLAVVPAGLASSGAHATDSPLCLPRTSRAVGGVPSAVEVAPPDSAAHPNLHRWSVTSPAMIGAAVTVNVLLPPGYSDPANAGVNYKVLYLLHGHGGGPDDWWKNADANHASLETVVGTLPLIVVMPDGGYDGWYSDWYGVDVDGHNGTDPNRAPAWESFHTNELLTFVDRTYRTVQAATGRLVAGLSMGGYGALHYGLAHPDLFAAAGSFSGALDIRLDDPAEPLVQPLFQNLPDRKPPDSCVWGDAVTQHDKWVAHNPADQVGTGAAAQRLAFYASSGDGCAPSPANPDVIAPTRCPQLITSPGDLGSALVEWGVRQQTESFKAKLAAYCSANGGCRPGNAFDLYSPGTHAWSYWVAELGKFVAWAQLPSVGVL